MLLVQKILKEGWPYFYFIEELPYLTLEYLYFFQNYPVYELSSFVFFIFPMCILCVLYIRMGLKIRETSGIQRNLPTTRTNLANNLHQQAANTLSNSSNSVVNTTGTQGYQDFKRGFKVILVKV